MKTSTYVHTRGGPSPLTGQPVRTEPVDLDGTVRLWEDEVGSSVCTPDMVRRGLRNGSEGYEDREVRLLGSEVADCLAKLFHEIRLQTADSKILVLGSAHEIERYRAAGPHFFGCEPDRICLMTVAELWQRASDIGEDEAR